MSSKKQGTVAEAEAILWFTKNDYEVFVPIGQPSNCDLVVYKEGKLLSVEVKSSTSKSEYGAYVVSLKTSGGNRSWTGEVKRINDKLTDMVFVHTPKGQYLIPAKEVQGNSSISVGKNAWTEYSV